MNQIFQLSLAAILVVFFVLGMIALVMIVLKILVNYFQYGGKAKAAPTPAEAAVAPITQAPAQENTFPEEVAAAITAAISEFTQGKKFVISSIIEKKPNSWQMMSRLTRLQRLQRKW